jgi:hypothetical protein
VAAAPGDASGAEVPLAAGASESPEPRQETATAPAAIPARLRKLRRDRLIDGLVMSFYLIGRAACLLDRALTHVGADEDLHAEVAGRLPSFSSIQRAARRAIAHS